MSDPTRFDLDERQRAMLAEMGVRVWWPERSDDVAPKAHATAQSAGLAQAAAAPAPAPDKPVMAASADTAPLSPMPMPMSMAATVRTTRTASPDTPAVPAGLAFAPLPAGLSGMAWAELEAAAKGCASCALCSARKTVILGSAHAPAHWMVVGDLPSEEEDDKGTPYNGPEGQLLDNMLQAVGVRRQSAEAPPAGQPQAYLTHAVKCRPPRGRNPEAAELAVCAGYLSRQVTLVQPRVILAMGRFAIQSLLGSTEPLGKLRGRLHDFQGVPVVATYDLANLLRQPDHKAKAWADLVLALQVAKT